MKKEEMWDKVSQEETLMDAIEETTKDSDGAFLVFLKVIMVMLLLGTFYLFEWGVEMLSFAVVYSHVYIKPILILLSSVITLGCSYLINIFYLKKDGSDPVMLKSFIIWMIGIVLLGTAMGINLGVGV